MEKYKYYPLVSVPTSQYKFLEYEADFDLQIDSIHISSSATVKAEIYVEGDRVATLFTNRNNLQTDYPFPIKLKKGQSFDIGVKNIDRLSADAYISFKETKKPRKRR